MFDVQNALPADLSVWSEEPGASFASRTELDAWFRTFQGPLVRWLTTKLGDPEAAKDVSQSAFLYLLRYVAEARVDYPQALLFKIAHWMALSEIRRRRRSRTHCVLIDDVPGIDDLASEVRATPEFMAMVKQETHLALNAMKSLPENVQTAFTLSRVEGLTYDEIAAAMNVSKSSIEKYMIMALKRLRATKAMIA